MVCFLASLRPPHSSCKVFFQSVKTSPQFRINNCNYQRDRSRSPITSLLLISLRWLGSGWKFYNLEESAGISDEAHRTHFHTLLDNGVIIFYPRIVKFPTAKQEGLVRAQDFNKSGARGNVGPMTRAT